MGHIGTPGYAIDARSARCAARWSVPIVALAILTLAFGGMAMGRLVDQDEGFYLLAARLSLEGKHPYIDFFYPQMPLLPYLYGWWMAVAGVSWMAARSFSAACSVILGALLYWRLAREPGTAVAGLLGVVLFVSSSLALGWFPLVKPHALSTLLLFASWLAMEHRSRAPDRMALGLAGAMLGLAIDTRLILAGTVPAFLVGCWQGRQTWPERRQALGWFMGGLALTLSPNLWFMARDLNTFAFDNLGYHMIRVEGATGSALWQRAEILLQLLGVPLVETRGSLQFSILAALTLWARLRLRSPDGGNPLNFNVVASLFVVSCLPSPIHLQYFSVMVPFLIFAGIKALPVALGSLKRPAGVNTTPRAKTLLLIALIAYLAPAPLDVYRFTVQGYDVPGIWGPIRAAGWTVRAVREVSTEIDRRTQSGEVIISWWPGYLVETHATILPGTENQFGVDVGSKLDGAGRVRRKVLSAEEISRQIGEGRVRVVLSGSSNFMDWTRALGRDSGYVLVTRIGDADLYVRQ